MTNVQLIRIRFTDATKEAQGFVALAKRLKVTCLPDDIYEIAKSGLAVLDELGIPYQILSEEAAA